MLIYRIKDGGDWLCWKAESMAAATKASEDRYIAEQRDAMGEDRENFEEEIERAHYRSDMLESCELVGELANP